MVFVSNFRGEFEMNFCLTCTCSLAGEVEEQIEQLEKLVPDWISSKLTPSGDVFFR